MNFGFSTRDLFKKLMGISINCIRSSLLGVSENEASVIGLECHHEMAELGETD